VQVSIAIVLILLWMQASARAQPAGEVSGSVYDQTGALLPGVELTIRGASSGNTQTDVAGNFAFRDLPAGDYEITAELNGFERARRAVRLQSGERVTISFTLSVAIVEATIVTGTRQGERDVQTIPSAISAVSNAELSRLGTQTLGEQPAFAPSVTVSQNTGFGQLTIRGIGATVLFAGSDPSSAIYLDGVYLARPAMLFTRFLDLERIEVLRGPQGTLYGRNAVGGAVNLIPRPPANDFEAFATLTAGSLRERRVTARVSGPLRRDRVMGSLALTTGVREGFVRDLEQPDRPLGGDDVTAGRGQLRLLLDRRTSLLLSADVDHQGGRPLTYNKVLAVKPGFQVDNPADSHEVRSSVLTRNHTMHAGASARLTAALTPSTTLVSLSAFRSLDFRFVVDSDSTELDLLTTQHDEAQHQFSQEVTVSHQRPGLAWVGGVFLFDERDHQTFRIDQPVSRVQALIAPRVDATSRAIFGQATVGLMPRLSATGGLRYTHEQKHIDNTGGRYSLTMPSLAVPGATYTYADTIVHTAWTPRIGLEWQLLGGAFTYASATRGFKSGGFNPTSIMPGRGYAPEWAWSYEGGFKGTFMGGRSRFDVSTFVMEYTNLQVQTTIGVGVFDIRNAAAATIRGVEVEHTSRLGRGIEAGGHATWLDATYDRYIAVAIGGATGDVTGNRLNNAPEWAGRFWIEWSGDIGASMRMSIAADATAQSTVFFTPFNDSIQRQRPYGVLGTRVEYGPRHRRWAVGAYARNLTNTDYIVGSFGTSPAAFAGRPGLSRQFAVDVTVRR